MHADRTNRLALIMLGLLLVAAAMFAFIASAGGFGESYSRRDLLANQAASWIGSHGSWFWWAAAGACLIITLLALRWIITLLLSTDRAGDITITRGGHYGDTTMHPAAITGAVTREIETYRGVAAARARVLGDPGAPELAVTVTAAPNDLASLHQRIETQALAHARQALGRDNLPVQLDINITSRDL